MAASASEDKDIVIADIASIEDAKTVLFKLLGRIESLEAKIKGLVEGIERKNTELLRFLEEKLLDFEVYVSFDPFAGQDLECHIKIANLINEHLKRIPFFNNYIIVKLAFFGEYISIKIIKRVGPIETKHFKLYIKQKRTHDEYLETYVIYKIEEDTED